MMIFRVPQQRKTRKIFTTHKNKETLNLQLSKLIKGSIIRHNLKNRIKYNLKWVTNKTPKKRRKVATHGRPSYVRTLNIQLIGVYRISERVAAATIVRSISRSSQSIWNRIIQGVLSSPRRVGKGEGWSGMTTSISIHKSKKDKNPLIILDTMIKICLINHTCRQVDIGKNWNF